MQSDGNIDEPTAIGDKAFNRVFEMARAGKKYRCSECGMTTEIERGLGDECRVCGSNSIEYRTADTNREILRDMIDDADEMTLVFIRERLAEICKPYLATPIEELRKEFGTTGFYGEGMADTYVRAAKEVKEAIRL